MEIVALPLLLLVGALLAVQAAANVQLAGAMTSPFGASTLQLGIGAALLLALAAAAGSLGAFGLLGDAAPWELAGGLGSAAYITAGILLFPRALVLAAALSLAHAPRPRVAPLRGMPWWGWLGGAVGATYVTSVFLLIQEIGAAPTIGLTVAGQQLASVLVDRHALLRLPRRPITRRRLLGVAALLAGVALVQLA